MTVRILTDSSAAHRAEPVAEAPGRRRWTLIPRSFRRHWHAWRHSAELTVAPTRP